MYFLEPERFVKDLLDYSSDICCFEQGHTKETFFSALIVNLSRHVTPEQIADGDKGIKSNELGKRVDYLAPASRTDG
jgi:hypothetical protein